MLNSDRKSETGPDGRMPLVEHLRELRNRVAKALLAIIVVTIIAAFFYDHIIDIVTKPVLQSVGCNTSFAHLAAKPAGTCARITLNGLLAPFTLALKVSLTAGVVVASPVWLYQLWAFVAPGLHRHEKRYARFFAGAGVPLFLGGALFAYKILPTTASVLIKFTPLGVDNLLPLDDLLDLVTRMIVVFGLSFEMPLLLVMLNFVGICTGRRMLGWWRGMIMGITVFAAVATPSVDPLSMLALAAPICLLYFLAVGVSIFHDRRKASREANEPDADEPSELDLTPEGVGAIEPVSPSPMVPERSGFNRVGEHDDIT
ncbi:twin-arginine translocase subunit TatC [Streptomyces sp. NBC_00859]|uniref:twin-arginine translocase subunit TatC n=1 Tax=Streptomyces sp. NBC_00859 TaxID=2903682 RepID=UPI0038640147